MNEKKEASGKSKKSLFSRIRTLCERKKRICHALSFMLLFFLLYSTLYFTYKRMSWERMTLIWAILLLVLILLTITSYRWEKKRKQGSCE